MTRLVLLSGWGIDRRIWRPLHPYWPANVEVAAVDWPGYGKVPALPDNASLSELATAMASRLPSDAVWVGWSLGGLLATALLDYLPAPRGYFCWEQVPGSARRIAQRQQRLPTSKPSLRTVAMPRGVTFCAGRLKESPLRIRFTHSCVPCLAVRPRQTAPRFLQAFTGWPHWIIVDA